MNRDESLERERFLGFLKTARLTAGLRQVDLARRLGRPQSFVSKYEKGERRLDIFELRQLCRALDVTLETLLDNLDRACSPPP